jgi:hypothetical protein
MADLTDAQREFTEELLARLEANEGEVRLEAREMLGRAGELIEAGDYEAAIEPVQELLIGCQGAVVAQAIRDA